MTAKLPKTSRVLLEELHACIPLLTAAIRIRDAEIAKLREQLGLRLSSTNVFTARPLDRLEPRFANKGNVS